MSVHRQNIRRQDGKEGIAVFKPEKASFLESKLENPKTSTKPR